MTAGVYAVRNTLNGMAYIGSSLNIEQRLQAHRSNLRRGAGCNRQLSTAWQAVGEERFEFVILETTVEDDWILTTAEQKWLDTYADRSYNLLSEARRALHVNHTMERVAIDLDKEDRRLIRIIGKSRGMSTIADVVRFALRETAQQIVDRDQRKAARRERSRASRGEQQS